MRLKKFFYDKKKQDKKTVIRLLRIPVYRCISDNSYRRKYFLGIRFSKRSLLQEADSISDVIKSLETLKNEVTKNFETFKEDIMNFYAVKTCMENNNSDVEKSAIFIPGHKAIAEYTVKIHSCQPESFDIFADVSNFSELSHLYSLHKNAHKIIFPISSFEIISRMRKYKNKVFVLG
ncbi:MAG: hypothetical protein K2M23_03030, partial [Alphaproteobacteria bacterium]|nr:hypothetical protein [Alphaproteobacteria bacterium]